MCRSGRSAIKRPVTSAISGLTLFIFFFIDTATTEIYTLSLHDALPICESRLEALDPRQPKVPSLPGRLPASRLVHRVDRKSTRLNSSHLGISYAVFCLKKKNEWIRGISVHCAHARDHLHVLETSHSLVG